MAFKYRAEVLGVRFQEGAPVIGIKRQGDNWILETPTEQFVTPSVVNACGAWGGKLASWLGDNLPIKARAPMLIITNRMPVFVGPLVGALGAVTGAVVTVIVGRLSVCWPKTVPSLSRMVPSG